MIPSCIPAFLSASFLMRTRSFLLGLCILTGIVSQIPAQVPVNQLPWRIGADQSGTNAYQGTMAGLRLYTRALTPEEIGKLREAGPEGKEAPAGVVAQWIAGGTKQ